MKIAVSAFGTEGDVRPAAALAAGLRRQGHDVWLIASPMYASLARQAGVPLRPALPQVTLEEYLARKGAKLAELLSITDPFRQVVLFFAMHTDEQLASLPYVREATADADVIAHSYLDISAYLASVIHDKPRIPLLYFHGMLPLTQQTMDGGPSTLLTRLQSRFSPWLLAQMTNSQFARLFKAAGLRPQRSILLRSTLSPLLTLLPISSTVYPYDPAWKRHGVVQTGFWFLDPPDFEPSAELAGFMSATDKPVVFNFGSMVSKNPKHVTELICEAVRRVGCRAVIQAGWDGLGEGELAPKVLRVGHVPHSWLLPRAAALIHHGGAGTSGAALRAGLPQAMAWFLVEQKLWGDMLFQRGIATARAVYHQQLSVEWLEQAIRRALEDEQLRQTAAAVGARIRGEDGVGQAVAAIEAACAGKQRAAA